MTALVRIAKSLSLGIALIVGASAVLLYSDRGARNVSAADPDDERPRRVVLVQQASIPALIAGVNGAIEALSARGFSDGGRMSLRRYNAEGDLATANAIAKDVTSSDVDLIITISTASLQTVANANRFATPPRQHVFGLTSDPFGAGVGINPDNHAEHPPHMTGVGSMPPVDAIFTLLRQVKPDIARVGLVWNPTEANSVAATRLARAVCATLGITLVEANAENATAVPEAAASVLSRGVDAVWISPDVTVALGTDAIIAAAKRARVPVFTSMPGNTKKGAAFDLGADYEGIGRVVGELAADVLEGRDPATVPVENVMPIRLHVNRQALIGLRQRWQFPAEVVARANVVFDDAGVEHVASQAPSAGGRSEPTSGATR